MVSTRVSLFMLLASLIQCYLQQFSSMIPIKLIIDIQKIFNTKCLFIITNTQEIQTNMVLGDYYVDQTKTLSSQEIPIAVLPWQNFTIIRWSIQCLSRPLYVVVLQHYDAKQLFKRISDNECYWSFTGVVNSDDHEVPPQRNPVWLYMSERENLANLFDRVHIPFNCEFLIVCKNQRRFELTEVYDITKPDGRLRHLWRDKYPLQKFQLGYWSKYGMQWTKTKIFTRRNNLLGAVVKVISFQHEPLTLINKGKAYYWNRIGGFVGNVWNVLEKEMNFSTVATISKYNSMVYLSKSIGCERMQIALLDFTVNRRTIRSLDYTSPLLLSRYQVYFRHPGETFQEWQSYLSPFCCTLWIAILSLIPIFALTLTMMCICLRHYGDQSAEGYEYSCVFNCLLYVYATFCNQGQDQPPRSTSCRIVFLLAHLTTVILLAAYSANLIASLTLQKTELPFEDLEGLLNDNRYKFDVIEGSEAEMILESSSDPVLAKLYSQLKRNNTRNKLSYPRSSHTALKEICSKNHALMTIEDYALSLNSQLNCRIIALPHFSLPVSIAFVVTKSFPYLDLINYNLNNMRRSGLLQKLFNDAHPAHSSESESYAPSVELQSISSNLFALLLGGSLATVLFVIEVIYSQWHRTFIFSIFHQV